MKSRLGGVVVAVAFMFGIIATTGSTADAQWRNSTYGGYNNQQIQQGYQQGLNTGANDAQKRQSYSPQRSRYYRNASSQAFREGFVRGYDQGYRQYAGSYGNGGYRNDGYYGNTGYGNNEQLQLGYSQGLSSGTIDRDRGQRYNPQGSSFYRKASSQAFREGFVRGYDEAYRRYPASNGGYRNDGYYGNRGGYGGYNNQEINNGYQQGLNTGASDGQKNQSYDPQRSRYYQNASSQAYREGFLRGYDEGYRQYNRNGNYRSNSTGILERIFGRP